MARSPTILHTDHLSRPPKRSSSVSPARAAAFDILLRVDRESSYASELLHAATYEHLSSADHALATELVMGVLRWRSRLDDDIQQASKQSLAKLDLEVLIALRLGLYQFRWLDRVPHHAALNESVELVKRARKQSAAPFVNAVLRKLSVAQSNSNREAKFSSPEEIASAYSHPSWIVERWIRQYGLDSAGQICIHNQSPPPTSIRIRDKKFIAGGITLAPGALLASAFLAQSGDITKTQAFRTGQITIQDEASQLVAALVSLEASGESARILDCCAAPGGKTAAIVDRNTGASITAVELHPHRARLMKKLLQGSAPAKQIQIIAADSRDLPFSASFERVLADVPCSGTGTLARNPEIKWRLKVSDLAELHDRQLAILRSAMARVAPKGRLIYSTCSLEKEENEDVIAEALEETKSFRIIDCRVELDRLKSAGELTWPDPSQLTRGPYLRTIPGVHPCDGFFAAILERI
jgi:16S rRNA (cytosine967-C5)-methyltransferase